jgi:uncharacterized protein (TIGR02001 family)
MNTKNALIIIAILFGAITSAWADDAIEGLTANLGATSNYLWRGLEQTNGDAAISGGVDFETNSGLYVGTWLSNASWQPGMTHELDLYGGYKGQFNKLSYDVGYIYYAYPDSDVDADFSEVFVSASYGVFTLAYSTLASATGASFADDSYLSVDADFDLGKAFALNLHIGTGFDEFYAGESFIEYGVSMNKSGFTFGVSKNDLPDANAKVYIAYSMDIDF